MVITKLEKGRSGKRINVYIDDKYAFSVERNLICDNKLYEGKAIRKEEVRKIIESDFIQRYFCKILKLISRRPRSEYEIRRYLNKKSLRNKRLDRYIDKIIKKLVENDYINDLEFAMWWVNSRLEFSPRGRYLLISELKQRGVSKEIVEKALAKILTKEKEVEIAKVLGEKKKRILGEISSIKNKKKFFDFLRRKGFNYDIVLSVWKSLC